MDKILAFVFLSAGIVYISRSSLRLPRSHGFYRFFAWELILALLLLNLNAWFQQPFSWHQLISWFLLLVCFIPLIFGTYSLISRGKPGAVRDEVGLFSFEKTSSLVTSGIYGYIRHPLYSSLILLTWGIYFKAPTWISTLLMLAATVFLVATSRADELECIRYFGKEYQDYMGRTKRFIPFIV